MTICSSLVDSGKIADVGYEDNINKELLIRISPELLITYGVGSEATGYMNKVRDLGVKVLFNADYLETDPLAKAEWIKVFGALYGCEEKAEEIFSSIKGTIYRAKIIYSRKCSEPAQGASWLSMERHMVYISRELFLKQTHFRCRRRLPLEGNKIGGIDAAGGGECVV